MSTKKYSEAVLSYDWLVMTGNIYLAHAERMEAAYQKID